MSVWDPLDLAVACHVIRWGGDYTEVPAAAVAALELGADGEHLAVLAGMSGAGWSEVDEQLRRVYPSERGSAQPAGRAAVALVAREFTRRVVDGEVDVRQAVALAEGLWIRLGCPSGEIGELGEFHEWLVLIESGTIEGTAASIFEEFVAACERMHAAGGPVVGDDIDLSLAGP